MQPPIDVEKIVLDFHNTYTEIGRLQNGLPSKKGKKDYSELENSIIFKARELKNQTHTFLQKLRFSDPKNPMLSQVENLNFGANQIERDPYKRFT